MAEHSDARPVSAYILIKTEEGAAGNIAARLSEQVEGGTVRRVMGPYDIVLAVEADGQEYITRMLHDKVRPVDGVVDADVLVWYEEGATAPAMGQELHSEDEERAA